MDGIGGRTIPKFGPPCDYRHPPAGMIRSRIPTMNTKVLLAVSLLCLINAPAQQAPNDEPRYTKEGQLLRPDNYREWIFLSAGLGMTYGTVDSAATPSNQRFDNVFVTPQAYRAFLQTGMWL